MTISRSEARARAAAADLEVIRFSSVEPDTINYEIYDAHKRGLANLVWWEVPKRMLANLIWWPDGTRTIELVDESDRGTVVWWGDEALERCSADFLALVRDLATKLDEWADWLREPGQVWHADADAALPSVEGA